MKNGNMPAAPTIATINRVTKNFEETQTNDNDFRLFGLTKREHIASMAMQGFLSSSYEYQFDAQGLAEYSVKYADALLAELEKSE